MKREIRDIIENDVVIPDIVLQAKEEAFAKIPDVAAPSAEKAEVALVKKTGRKFKKKWIAVAMVAVLAIGTMSAGAATDFNWYQLIEEELYVSEMDKELAEKYGLGKAQDISVKSKGATITVEQTFFDSRAFFVVLSIDGVEKPQGTNDGICFSDFYAGTTNGVKSESMGGSYVGVDEESGKMLYVCNGALPVSDGVEDTLVLELGDMANIAHEPTEDRQECIQKEVWRVDGTWKFEIPIEYSTAVIEGIYPNKPVYSGVELMRVRISPLAIEFEWSNPSGLNTFYGFLMKDETIKHAWSGGGAISIEPQCGGAYVSQDIFGTIVDIEEIEAILLYDMEAENVDYDNPTVDDFIVVPLPQ